jgi:hypothetical protein
MSAWGTGTFDNDDAADWLDEFTAADDETLLQAALEAPEIEEGYLEAPEAARILCACEIIAAIRGKPASELPEEALTWVKQHAWLDVSALVPAAISRIDRILAENSELDQLWRENQDEYPTWRGSVLALKARLG